MNFTIFKSKNSQKASTKTLILKKVFNSGAQKRMVTRAARESAEDQKRMLKKYEQLVATRAAQ